MAKSLCGCVFVLVLCVCGSILVVASSKPSKDMSGHYASPQVDIKIPMSGSYASKEETSAKEKSNIAQKDLSVSNQCALFFIAVSTEMWRQTLLLYI